MNINCCMAMTKFGENLKRIMSNKDISQLKLSKLSGVDQSMISNYLRSDDKVRIPNLDTFIKIAIALNCSLYELSGEEEHKKLDQAAHDMRDREHTLSPEQQKMIDMFDRASPEEQKRLMNVMAASLGLPVPEDEDSTEDKKEEIKNDK